MLITNLPILIAETDITVYKAVIPVSQTACLSPLNVLTSPTYWLQYEEKQSSNQAIIFSENGKVDINALWLHAFETEQLSEDHISVFHPGIGRTAIVKIPKGTIYCKDANGFIAGQSMVFMGYVEVN